jgi:hypothetical protein
MPEDGVVMWPNETRDLIRVGAADHGELYPLASHQCRRRPAIALWSIRASLFVITLEA